MILENVWGPGYVREVNYLNVYAYRSGASSATRTAASCRAIPHWATGWPSAKGPRSYAAVLPEIWRDRLKVPAHAVPGQR